MRRRQYTLNHKSVALFVIVPCLGILAFLLLPDEYRRDLYHSGSIEGRNLHSVSSGFETFGHSGSSDHDEMVEFSFEDPKGSAPVREHSSGPGSSTKGDAKAIYSRGYVKRLPRSINSLPGPMLPTNHGPIVRGFPR